VGLGQGALDDNIEGVARFQHIAQATAIFVWVIFSTGDKPPGWRRKITHLGVVAAK
jgi:hypothetical protein